MKHINEKPIVITGNGSTHVNTAYPVDRRSDGIEIYNSSATVLLFVKSGDATTIADATCQFVEPGQKRVFAKNPNDTCLDIVFEAASTAKVYATSTDAFGDKS